MTLQAAIAGLQDLVGAVTGIKGAPDYAPESVGTEFMAVAYPSEGSIQIRVAGEMQALHTIVLEIHAPRKNLPSDIQGLVGFGDSVPKAILADTTLGGTVSTFGSIEYTFGVMSYNGQATIGWRFKITGIKLRTTL